MQPFALENRGRHHFFRTGNRWASCREAGVNVAHTKSGNGGTRIVLALLIVVLHARPALAQGPRVSFPEPVSAPMPLPADSGSIPQTHWVRGAVIGGATLGLLSALLAAGLCSFNETGENCTAETTGAFFIGAALGAGIGAFIGARFPKHPKPTEPATTD